MALAIFDSLIFVQVQFKNETGSHKNQWPCLIGMISCGFFVLRKKDYTVLMLSGWEREGWHHFSFLWQLTVLSIFPYLGYMAIMEVLCSDTILRKLAMGNMDNWLPPAAISWDLAWCSHQAILSLSCCQSMSEHRKAILNSHSCSVVNFFKGHLRLRNFPNTHTQTHKPLAWFKLSQNCSAIWVYPSPNLSFLSPFIGVNPALWWIFSLSTLITRLSLRMFLPVNLMYA